MMRSARPPLTLGLVALLAACPRGSAPIVHHCDPQERQGCVPTVVPLEPAVVAARRVAIPGLPAGSIAYNAGLVAYGDGYLMAFRLDRPAPGENPVTAQVGVVALDAAMRPVGDYSLLDTAWPGDLRPTAEDPRIFTLAGEPYVLYNTTHAVQDGTTRHIHVGRLVRSTGSRGPFMLADAKEILFAVDGRLRSVEKNWTPFVHDGDLHLLYDSNPPQVLRVETAALAAAGHSTWARAVDGDTRRVPWDSGQIRGGTPAIYDPDLDAYVTVFHSSARATLRPGDAHIYYFMGIYTFAPRPPFEIRQMVPMPLVHGSFYRRAGAGAQIVFPQGLVLDGPFLHLSYGQDDATIRVMTLDRAAIYALLTEPAPPDEPARPRAAAATASRAGGGQSASLQRARSAPAAVLSDHSAAGITATPSVRR